MLRGTQLSFLVEGEKFQLRNLPLTSSLSGDRLSSQYFAAVPTPNITNAFWLFSVHDHGSFDGLNTFSQENTRVFISIELRSINSRISIKINASPKVRGSPLRREMFCFILFYLFYFILFYFILFFNDFNESMRVSSEINKYRSEKKMWSSAFSLG